MASSVAYVVSDFGGEWEDSWEYPVIAFTDEGRARECAAKRKARRESWRTPDSWDDYTGSTVQAVPLVIEGDSHGLAGNLGLSAIRKLGGFVRDAARREPIEVAGVTYVPAGAQRARCAEGGSDA